MSECMYPVNCRKAIRRLMNEISVSSSTAYAMILMTATLMDLRPEDERVVDIILEDYGIFPEIA